MSPRTPFDLWLDIAYWIGGGDAFRAGFIAAAMLVLGYLAVIGPLLRLVYARWLRIRQFFQATKRPAEAPTKPGPSPFSDLVGCIGALVFLVAVLIFALWSYCASAGAGAPVCALFSWAGAR